MAVTELVTGGDPKETYRIPLIGKADFAAAPDLEEIGTSLIEACDEFDEIANAIEDGDLAITYVWKKKGAKSDGMTRTGALAKTGGMVKHFARATYVIGLSADANYGRTRLQVEAEVYHQLTHIKIDTKLVGKGDDKVEVPVFKKRHHDLEMFYSEVERYGLWRTPLVQAKPVFEQAGLPLATIDSPKRAQRTDRAQAAD